MLNSQVRNSMPHSTVMFQKLDSLKLMQSKKTEEVVPTLFPIEKYIEETENARNLLIS